MKQIFIACLVALAVTCTGFAQTSSAVLTNWMDLHSRMVRASKGAVAHVAYSRHFSYAAIAAYESIVSSDPAYRSLSGQLNGLNALPKAGKGQFYGPASLNAAYAEVLRKYYNSFGTCKAAIDSMEAAQLQSFPKANAKQIEKSVEYGRSVAAAILQWAEEDLWESKNMYTPLTGEGVWQPAGSTAAVPFWADKRSMTKDLSTVYSLKQPVYAPDTDGMFYKMANEVYTTSVNLTPEQKAIALHWDDAPNGRYMSVFGHWTYILSGLIKKHQFPLLKAAEAYARMSISMHEAGILAWKGKYQYNVVRPITFINQHINKDWKPLISTPPHPEFPAAHATLSYAAAVALCAMFGEACAVSDNSYTDIGMTERSYASLRDAAKEAGMSRLYGGIHYRYSIEQGFILGEAAAKYAEKTLRFH